MIISALDITAIIVASIGVITAIITGIFKLIQKRKSIEQKNDAKQWEIINKMLDAIIDKQKELCDIIREVRNKVKKGNEKNN